MTKVKICGLSREEDILAVNRWRPDYIGFVFAPSRRRVTFEKARYLKSFLNPEITAVGVFVDEPLYYVASLVQDGIVDAVQLHGDEDASYIENLKQKVSCPVIKAVRVKSKEQILDAEKLPCDMLLLDSYQEDTLGGSGKSFDYSLIPSLNKPFFLAGGLNASNIQKAILTCSPYGVDISSGVETDGLKDEQKIRELIEAMSSFNNEREAGK